jgi:hypothetical protein
MEGLENTTVIGVDKLATLYARPSERVFRKEIDHVDAVGRAFIAASPFLILATGGSQGLDCSPKGDKAWLRPGRGRRPSRPLDRQAGIDGSQDTVRVISGAPDRGSQVRS